MNTLFKSYSKLSRFTYYTLIVQLYAQSLKNQDANGLQQYYKNAKYEPDSKTEFISASKLSKKSTTKDI
jgi:hypothetical protein